MKKRIGFLLLCMFCVSWAIHAQITVKGVILDADTKEPLIGASIFEPNSKLGTVSDLDGSFTLKLPSSGEKVIEITYVGYLSRKESINIKNEVLHNMETILMKPDVVALGDVVVTSSVAIRRKTPVALSVIEPTQLEYKLGTQEFPEILKSTPSVYATKQGGGFGDARVNIRGFASENVAVMVNGVPVNDMEWGGVYWSNWTGLSDVARSVQVQRGLGASKVSAPSVGGLINIQTKTTDAEKGGSVYYGMGNDNYSKIAFNVSTGLTENKWAVTLLGSKTWGANYILGTEFNSYSYFLNISKIINDQHTLSFTGTGSPQEHVQRYNGDMLLISEWQKVKERYKFNPTYGFDSQGVRKTANFNHYHKPQLSLNHYWTIDESSSLSTALYLSIGDGGGYAWRGNLSSSLYGTNTSTGMLNTTYRKGDYGYMDYGKLEAENADSPTNPNGSQAVITDSRNNHIWVGLLSSYTKKLTQEIELTGGLDLRYYEGLHDAYIVDLMGGSFFIDPARATVTADNSKNAGNPAWVNKKLKEGDIVYRDNTGYVAQSGVFGQVEYTKDNLSTFISGSISNNTYWKVDRFYYDNAKSDVGNFLGYTIKGGANYNLTSMQNVFANIGYVSRAPFMSGGYFTNIHQSNATNPNAVNEKLFSVELGYGFTSKYFTASLNAYNTMWMDKTMVSKLSGTDDSYINMEGLDALHQGVELEMTCKPINDLTLKGMVSVGNWRWNSNATGYAYNKDGQAVDKAGNPVKPLSPEHAKSEVNLKGVKVGNSAQTTMALEAKYKLLKDFTVGADFTYYGHNYANFTISSPSAGSTPSYNTPWMIPEAGLVDLNAQYHFKIGNLDATLLGNVNNLLDQTYISDAKDLNISGSTPSTWENVSVMYGFGRTYSVAIKVKF